MKKVFCLLIATVLICTLAACGEKTATAEKNCQNCGEIVADDAAFCDSCGSSLTSSQESQTESLESNTDSTSSLPSDDDFYDEDFDYRGDDYYDYDYDYVSPPTSSNVSEPDEEEHEHEHSFVPKVTNPTCTEEGYTTYTCSCGDSYDDDYTEPKHTYAEHICKACGSVEPSYTYEYLLNWYKENGNEPVEIKPYDGIYTYTLEYDEEKAALFFKQRAEDSEYNSNTKVIYSEVVLVEVFLNSSNKFDYRFYWKESITRVDPYYLNKTYIEITGVIEGDEYTGGSLDYTYVSGDKEYLSSGLSEARRMVNNMLDLLDEYFEGNIPEITVQGLGFEKY